MLFIRHSIGSRLLCQTELYTIENKGERWEISLPIDEETSSRILNFKHELNVFQVNETEKTWYYSSDAQVNYQPNEKQLLILVDHKTVYPTK
jgi:hypothetical protein